MALRRPTQFDTLLRVRELREGIQGQVMAAARREVFLARGQREDLARQQRRIFEAAARIAQKDFDARDVRRHFQFARHLSRVVDEKDAEIKELEGLAEAERTKLEEAMKARRVVEKLKQRRMNTYLKELGRIEQRALDEIATTHNALGFAPRPLETEEQNG